MSEGEWDLRWMLRKRDGPTITTAGIARATAASIALFLSSEVSGTTDVVTATAARVHCYHVQGVIMICCDGG